MPISEITILAGFIAGFAGSVYCVAICGGLVGVISASMRAGLFNNRFGGNNGRYAKWRVDHVIIWCGNSADAVRDGRGALCFRCFDFFGIVPLGVERHAM